VSLSSEDWVSIGPVDHTNKATEGAIELPASRWSLVEGRSVVVVKNSSNTSKQVQLTISRKKVRAAVVSDADFGRLGFPSAKVAVEIRGLKLREQAKRKVARVALPLLTLIAAVATVISLLCPDLKDATGIVAAGAALPAAGLAAVRALREP